jgi:hypothetical protein
MKPLNLDNSPCAPQSSNCVIWQGPNIPCIKLCTGDTISDVTYKLATELCTIMSELNLTNYDLSCLNLTTSEPTTFNELIQLLISKICELEDIPTDTTPGTGGCPDCVVTVASCFQTGGQTTMQLLDYVTAIANKVCVILLQITAINTSITNLTARVVDLEAEILNPPAPYVPDVTISECTIGSLAPGTYPVDIVVSNLINDTGGFCSLIAATGTPANIIAAYASQTVLSTSLRLTTGTAMSTIAGWINTPVGNLSQTIIDLWICIKDIRDAFKNVIVTKSLDANSGADVVASTVGVTTTYTVSSKTTEVTNGAGITVTPVITGLKTTYAVSVEELGSVSNLYVPAANNFVAPSYAVTLFINGVSQPLVTPYYTNVLPAIATVTGIWTCATTGLYNISFVVRMQIAGGFSSGMVVAGIVSPLTSDTFVSNTVSINQVTRTVEMSGTALGVPLTSSSQLVLKVLNMTGQNYIPIAGDVVSMTIQRVK